MFVKLLTFLMPWPLRRRALNSWFGYEIKKGAHIGWSWIFPRKLNMAANAKIDHLNVAIHIDEILMEENTSIGRGNWITGYPTGTNSGHFKHQQTRNAKLILGNSSCITKNHHLDCTNIIEIGKFSMIAGYNSQLLTHSIDLKENYQDSAPIYIGEYSFVGTNAIILPGSVLPSYSVLGAKSLLNKKYSEEWMLYGGVPAKKINQINKKSKYFARLEGYVY
jgi:acetyltransferase-like isoleucine patch superfamily enzyme